jgi:hypothetical protein
MRKPNTLRNQKDTHMKHHSRLAGYFTLPLCLTALLTLPALPTHAQVAVVTQNGDNARTGADLAETTLTPTNVNVNRFGKLFTITLNANVNGQVLYVPGVTIGGASHNVLYAYTSNNADNQPSGLYACDADSGTQLWNTAFPNSAQYTTPTPVIDPVTNTIYVLTKTVSDDTGATFLHAIDITTGLEKPGSPIQVQASAPGTGDGAVNGAVHFDGPSSGTARFHANDRPGLLFLNGIIYAGFAHNSDSFPYHGWVLGYQYDGTAFTQKYVFCTTPNGSDGGIWMSGKGLSADQAGNIYCSVGNGTFDANTKGITSGTDYGMCYLKLSPSLQVLDYFAPHDEGSNSQADLDLGNSGLVGIPGTTRFFGGGTKFGSGFLLDSTNLGGFTAGGPDKAILRIDGLSGNGKNGQNPVAWNLGDGLAKTVYLWPPGSNLEQFAYDPTAGTFSPAGIAKQTTGLTAGGSLAVTANAGTNGILWTVGQDHVVRAFDATDVTKTDLWDSSQNSTRDSINSVGHFQFPTVANGKVYVPTGSSTIVAYGLLPATVSGTVSLQNVAAGNMAQPLTFTLTPTGVTAGGAIITQAVTPAAADGSFTLTGIPAGTYTLGIKGSKWLRKDVALDTTGGNVTGLSVSLLGGDANGDNQVTALDLLAVKNAYNTVLGGPNYNAAADFNCDGQVTALDLLIVKLNYNKTGDP